MLTDVAPSRRGKEVLLLLCEEFVDIFLGPPE
jgi:hypothetical protein